MSLRDRALAANGPVRHGPPCSVGKMLDLVRAAGDAWPCLDDNGKPATTTADEILALVDDTDLRYSTVAEILEEIGLPIKVFPITKHRNRGTVKGCTCPR